MICIWTAITILPKSRFEFFSFGSDYKCIEDVKSNKEIYMRGNLSSYHKMLVFDTSSVSTNNWAFVTFLLLSAVVIGFKNISRLNHQNCAYLNIKLNGQKLYVGFGGLWVVRWRRGGSTGVFSNSKSLPILLSCFFLFYFVNVKKHIAY